MNLPAAAKTHMLQNRREWLACAALSCAPATLLAAQARATDGALRLGTSTPGGGFSLYGQMLERVLNAHTGRPLLHAIETRGTTENLQLLQRGELDAALIQGTVAGELLDSGKAAHLRVLHAMYPSPGMLAVPAASPAQRLDALRGQRVVFGVRTSGLVTLARQVFDGMGLDIDRDFQAIYVEQAAQSPRIVLASEAAGLWGAGEGWPGFEAVAKAPGGARFLGPDAAQIERIRAKYPLLQAMQVPAGLYPGIDRPLATVGSVNLILARADLDLLRASAFVQAMRDTLARLAEQLPQAAFSTLANTVASVASPAMLHAAVRSASP